MELTTSLETYEYLLMEAAIIENLIRSGRNELHPRLLTALLIYDDAGQKALIRFMDDYIAIANRADVPILICTPTWRANLERLFEAGIEADVNGDAVAFLKTIRERWDTRGVSILIGGLMGCQNDSYRPEQGLITSEAKAFHSWQADRLAAAGPDFLMAATMPAVGEARGMAQALEKTGLPYIISFVIDREGRVLDGSSLADAILDIDSEVKRPPVGYMVNCAYPTFLNPETQPKAVFERLIGYQANGSSLDHCQLDNADTLQTDNLADWGEKMIALNRRYGIKILGGCCGTGREHLEYIVENIGLEKTSKLPA